MTDRPPTHFRTHVRLPQWPQPAYIQPDGQWVRGAPRACHAMAAHCAGGRAWSTVPAAEPASAAARAPCPAHPCLLVPARPCPPPHPRRPQVPSRTNFTSLATPNQVGSGRTALVTLLHEGGHAAHFSGVLQRSPFFRRAVRGWERGWKDGPRCAGRLLGTLTTGVSAAHGRQASTCPPCLHAPPRPAPRPALLRRSQERAPTSVAYAETQSMTLDSLAGDAAWLGRYGAPRGARSPPAPSRLATAALEAQARPTFWPPRPSPRLWSPRQRAARPARCCPGR